ncbi:hypothetical protein PTTG_11203, partial [Puccinia triticina 1-1 BBBD Race 1]
MDPPIHDQTAILQDQSVIIQEQSAIIQEQRAALKRMEERMAAFFDQQKAPQNVPIP